MCFSPGICSRRPSRSRTNEEEEQEVGADENQNEFLIDESELKCENDSTDVNDGTDDEEEEEEDDDIEQKVVVTPLRIKLPGLNKIKDEDSGTDASQNGMEGGGQRYQQGGVDHTGQEQERDCGQVGDPEEHH